MRCETCREALSARLDGEHALGSPGEVDRHLASCAACRDFASAIERVHRMVRVRGAEAVPDLTPRIMAAVRPERSTSALAQVRSGLTFVGMLLLLFALPLVLVDGGNTPPHLAAWDAAFGVALLVTAWQPGRARGLFPMAAAMAGVMGVATTVEISAGHDPAHGLLFHVLEVAGVALLWLAARDSRPVRRDTPPLRPLSAV